MKDLYTFSKRSWHVRFFKWIFNSDPTEMYKTMCPYFWTYVVVMMFLPLILIVKLFGKGGSKLLNDARTYRDRKEKKLTEKLMERFRLAIASGDPDEINRLSRSKCWKKFGNQMSYKVDYSEMTIFYNLRDKWEEKERERRRELKHMRNKTKEIREQKIEDIKESITGKIIGYTMLVLVIGALGYLLFILFRWLIFGINWPPANWPVIGTAVGILAGVILLIYLTYLSIKYLMVPFFSWVACNLRKVEWPKFPIGKYIAIPFILFWKLLVLIYKCIAIVCSMIYATYKRYCPVITWKE